MLQQLPFLQHLLRPRPCRRPGLVRQVLPQPAGWGGRRPPVLGGQPPQKAPAPGGAPLGSPAVTRAWLCCQASDTAGDRGEAGWLPVRHRGGEAEQPPVTRDSMARSSCQGLFSRGPGAQTLSPHHPGYARTRACLRPRTTATFRGTKPGPAPLQGPQEPACEPEHALSVKTSRTWHSRDRSPALRVPGGQWAQAGSPA